MPGDFPDPDQQAFNEAWQKFNAHAAEIIAEQSLPAHVLDVPPLTYMPVGLPEECTVEDLLDELIRRVGKGGLLAHFPDNDLYDELKRRKHARTEPPDSAAVLLKHLAEVDSRPCSCHPDEAPVPCQQRHAYSECKAAERADPGRDHPWWAGDQ